MLMEHQNAGPTPTPVRIVETTIAGFPGIMAKGSGDRQADPVVCLHGAFGDHSFFRPWLSAFAAAGFDSYAVSRRGRNRVPPEPAAGVHMQDYLDDALGVVDALGGTPIVVGHSLGGLLAQQVAAVRRCRAAILVAPAPPGMLTPHPRALPVLLAKLPGILLGRPFLLGRQGASHIALNRVPAQQRAEIYDRFVPESGVTFRQMMFGRIRVDPRRVTCPVLVVGGTNDRIISRRVMRRTARHYHADIRTHREHGHWIPQEPGGDVVVADIVRWLDSRS